MALLPCKGVVSPAQIPVFTAAIAAGFPSPADDFKEGTLDFNQLLIRHPAATYCVRVSGNSMIGAGIQHGAFLVVDRSESPENGRVVVAALDGELTVKRLICEKGKYYLFAENADFEPIALRENQDVVIWGCATYAIHRL
jgi:DNA polymerase V